MRRELPLRQPAWYRIQRTNEGHEFFVHTQILHHCIYVLWRDIPVSTQCRPPSRPDASIPASVTTSPYQFPFRNAHIIPSTVKYSDSAHVSWSGGERKDERHEGGLIIYPDIEFARWRVQITVLPSNKRHTSIFDHALQSLFILGTKWNT